MLCFLVLFWYNDSMEKNLKNHTRNTEMVTISRAEYDAIQQELVAALLQHDWLMEQMNVAKRKLFGRSSEKAGEAVMEQLSLVMNEAEAIDAGSYDQETAKSKVTAHTPNGAPVALRM